jgi:hypothetical protein
MRASVATKSFYKKAIGNLFLAQIRTFTYISHLFVFLLAYPLNTLNFFAALFPMISFDVFPADDWILEPYLGYDQIEQESVNE